MNLLQTLRRMNTEIILIVTVIKMDLYLAIRLPIIISS
jgi:hypothetical protein